MDVRLVIERAETGFEFPSHFRLRRLRMNLPVVAHIGNRSVSREEVRAWELRRARIVARKLGLGTPTIDLGELNRRILDRQRELGHAGIERLLSRELRVAGLVALGSATLSRGRRRFCTIELTSRAGAAEDIPRWYAGAIAANDEEPLIGACPDHYLSRSNPDGTQEIIETTRGSPFAVRMFFDNSDTTSILAPAGDTAVALAGEEDFGSAGKSGGEQAASAGLGSPVAPAPVDTPHDVSRRRRVHSVFDRSGVLAAERSCNPLAAFIAKISCALRTERAVLYVGTARELLSSHRDSHGQ